MKMPHVSIRELLMLTTIAALSIPYIYEAFNRPSAFDFSFSDVRAIVQAIEPRAILLIGGSENEFSDMTYAIPPNSSSDFVKNIRDQMEKRIVQDGWTVHSSGYGSRNGHMAQFSYKLVKGKTQCSVRFVQIHFEEKSRYDDGTGLQDVRFLLFVDQYQKI